MRSRFGLAAAVFIVLIVVLVRWQFRHQETTKQIGPQSAPTDTKASPAGRPKHPDISPTKIYAHNLMLRKGPNFRVYVRWLNGRLARARSNVNPSFDDPDSFYLDISTGVLRANIGDIGNFLNNGLTDSPLKNIKLSGDGDQINLTGTLRKGIALPIRLSGTISATGDNRIHVHVTKLNVLKLPLKGLLGIFDVSVADLFHKSVDGLEVVGNDLFFDTQKLLPPPHIRGHLTKVHIVNPDLEEIFGDATEDVERAEQWRNFLRLNGGTLDFGKLTMNTVDLIMIDISKDPWFDLDLVNYQAQFTNGYTRVTAESGLQIFMPDRREVPLSKAKQDDSIEWFKNRNIPPPPHITARTR
jgi:hypothetical protein